MMDKVAKVVGYIVLALGAFFLFIFLIDATVEATVGDSDDRKCEAFAEAVSGTATNIGRFGPCYVNVGDFQIRGPGIREKP